MSHGGERWLLFAVCLVLMAGATGLGYWLGKKSERAATITIVVGLVGIMARAGFLLFPLTEFALFPGDFYAIARPWWPIPFIMATLMAGAQHMSTENAKKLVSVFVIAIMLTVVQRLWATATFDPTTMSGQVVSVGSCEQTTDYTCGASAAATLLHYYGIESNEREMAELCWTNSLTGTDFFCVARGLRRKLAGQDKRVARRYVDWEALASRDEPALVTIKWGALVDHWVVVRSIDDQGRVLLLDPLQGLDRVSKDEFLAKWRRGMVTIEAS